MHDANQLEPFDPDCAMTLADACKTLKSRHGKRLNLDVAQRYARNGTRIAGRQRLYLPTVIIGGIRWTMPSWVRWWQMQRAGGPPPTIRDDHRPRTELQASRGHNRAVARLRKAGFKIGGAA